MLKKKTKIPDRAPDRRIPFYSEVGKAKQNQLAGGPGFEPGLTESESAVLPLNYPPTPGRTDGDLRGAPYTQFDPLGLEGGEDFPHPQIHELRRRLAHGFILRGPSSSYHIGLAVGGITIPTAAVVQILSERWTHFSRGARSMFW